MRSVLSAGAGLAGSAVGAVVRAGARRPAVVLVGIAVIGGAGIFSWNATMKQTGQHPAPLFAAARPEPAPVKPEPQRRSEGTTPLTTGTTRTDLPVPPPRPAGPDAIGSIIRAGEGPARAAETKPAEPKKTVAAKPVESKPKTAEKVTPSPEAKPVAQARVTSAQKALAKLGYGPITADGILGTATRQAIEKFEREKKLPVTGALQDRTAKKLATLSGITIQ